MATSLCREQKRTLFRDGYVVLRNAVSQQLVAASRVTLFFPRR